MLERGERVTVVDVRKREQHAEGDTRQRELRRLRRPEGRRRAGHGGSSRLSARGHLLQPRALGRGAAEQLRRRGYEAFSLEGGLEAWKDL